MWNDRFRIGNGQKVSESAAYPVYRSYLKDCGMELDKDEWTRQASEWSIYYPSNSLSPVKFTPKAQPAQTSTNWYFLMLDLKIPRPK